MSKGLLAIGGVILVVVLIAGFFIGRYNSFVTEENAVDEAQANVETQLQRRFDLIPNLVESVKGIFDQEQDVFDAIAEARTQYDGSSAGSSERVEAANNYESAIGRLLVVVENYPDLRSQENVSQLMDELAGTENRISVERRRYNEIATDFNNLIETFPNNFIAGLFGFDEKTLFEAAEGAEDAPVVDLADGE